MNTGQRQYCFFVKRILYLFDYVITALLQAGVFIKLSREPISFEFRRFDVDYLISNYMKIGNKNVLFLLIHLTA